MRVETNYDPIFILLFYLKNDMICSRLIWSNNYFRIKEYLIFFFFFNIRSDGSLIWKKWESEKWPKIKARRMRVETNYDPIFIFLFYLKIENTMICSRLIWSNNYFRKIEEYLVLLHFTWKSRIRWFVHDWSDLTIILEKLKNI